MVRTAKSMRTFPLFGDGTRQRRKLFAPEKIVHGKREGQKGRKVPRCIAARQCGLDRLVGGRDADPGF